MTPLALLVLVVLVAAVVVGPIVASRREGLTGRRDHLPLPGPLPGPLPAPPPPGSRPASTVSAPDAPSPIDPDRIEARLRRNVIRSLEAAVERDPRAVADALRRMMREPPPGRS